MSRFAFRVQRPAAPATPPSGEASVYLDDLGVWHWIDELGVDLPIGGGGVHPDLTAHDLLGLATQTELDGHTTAASPHSGHLTSSHEVAADPHTGYQKESEKAAANGYASLDGSGLVPDAQISSAIARDSEVSTAVSTHEGAADPHGGYQKESEKDAANGYAGLDANTRVPVARLGSGTPSSSVFLRGDGAWASPPGGSGSRLPQGVSLGGYVVVTNVGASYDAINLSKGLGLAIVDFTGVASVRFDAFVNKIGTGTQSWQLWNVTDGSQLAVLDDAGGAGDKTLTTTISSGLPAGVKVLRVRAKSTVATDDPVYYGAAIALS